MEGNDPPRVPEELKEYLDVLDERSRRFAILRLGVDIGEPRTVDQVAALLGITVEDALSIDASNKERLRHPIFPEVEGTLNLRDATLLDLAVDWSARSVRVRLQTTDKEIWIVADGLEALRLTNVAPWGYSASVLEVGLLQGLGTGQRAVIRLESGDEIELLAERINLLGP